MAGIGGGVTLSPDLIFEREVGNFVHITIERRSDKGIGSTRREALVVLETAIS